MSDLDDGLDQSTTIRQGDATPSPDDHELTKRLAAAGVVMGIDLVDHIVLGDSRYCSFKEMGKL